MQTSKIRIGLACLGVVAVWTGMVSEAFAKSMAMVYDKPAGVWNEALPIGNGRLGGMVFGGTATERIQLNEDTFWAGSPAYEPLSPNARRAADTSSATSTSFSRS